MDALIIDGYSLLFRSATAPPSVRTPEWIERERATLIERITRSQAQLPRRILLVFDGRESSRAFNLPSTRVEILFSTGTQSADLLIEELLRREPTPGAVRVVTSDRRVTERAQCLGATTTTCSNFLDTLKEQEGGVAREIRRSRTRSRLHKLGDYFPGGEPPESPPPAPPRPAPRLPPPPTARP